MPLFKATPGGLAIPEGVYAATAMCVDERPPGENSKTEEDWWAWTLILQSGPKRGAEILAGSSQRTGPGAKARRWVEALLGRDVGDDEAFDFASILPRDCQVLIRKNARGFASVQDILPVQTATPGAPTSTQTSAPDPDGDLPF